ncbi:MAG: UDP-N-acetylglucosamine 2-epimerase, partial [Alphaproteobacteria bacterium]|nr:UDP-N-acetylglucosamine 2-epimerase [Alphaproteobacteria bacterium]
SYELLRPEIERRETRKRFGLASGTYGVVTLHRPSNVDDERALGTLVDQLRGVAERLPLVFPVHPRTRQSLDKHGLMERLSAGDGLRLTPPMGYIDFMSLVREARLVITDSGGIQEETTYLGIPCLTLRDTTERPITITQGTNRLVRPDDLLDTTARVMAGDRPTSRCPELWDGQTAGRVAASLKSRIA